MLKQQLDAAQLKSFYTADGYWRGHVVHVSGHPPIDKRAEQDFGDRIPVWHELVARFKPSAKSLLEIGCSHGGFLHYCRERGIPDVVGVEVDQATCDFARRRFNLPHVQSGLFPDVELPRTQFDVISGFDVLEHFLEPVRALQAVARLLKDDGVFIFQTPCYRGENDGWEQFRPEEHVFLFDDHNVHRVLEQADLEVVNILPGYFRDDMFVIGRKRQVVKNILFVRSDAIGDNVLAGALLAPIKARYPDARITVVCQEIAAPLYRACPHVDDIIAFDKACAYQDEHYRDRLLARMQAVQADLAMNSVYSPEPITDLLVIGSGARRIVALQGDTTNMNADLHAQRNERYDRLLRSSGEWRPELERHADFLAGLGVTAPELHPEIWLGVEDERFADDFFRKHGLTPERTLLLFAGASHPMRVYTRYAESLVGVCREYGLTVLAVGVDADREFSQGILDAVGVPGINLCGELTLMQMAAILKRCRLALGAETGTAHMACALDVPQIVVLGGGHFGRFMPYSASTRAVALPLECYGCNWHCKFSTAHCVQDIAPVVIEQALRHALSVQAGRPTLFVQGHALSGTNPALPSWHSFDKWLPAGGLEIIAVGAVPDSAIAYWQAQQFQHDRRFTEAEVALEKARMLAVDEESTRIGRAVDLNRKGEQLFEAGDMTGAAAAFAQAIALNPRCIDAQNNLAVLSWQQGDAERALNCLIAALEYEPDNRDVVLNGAKILAGLANGADALLLCRSFLEIHPEDQEVQALVAQLSAASAAAEPATNNGAQAVTDGPDGAPVPESSPEEDAAKSTAAQLLRQGIAVFSSGDIQESIRLFERSWSMDPDIGNIDAVNNLMVAWWSLGDIEPALQYMRAALQVDSGNRSTVVNSIKILSTLSRIEEAAACCASYVAGHPFDEETATMHASLQESLANFRNATLEQCGPDGDVLRQCGEPGVTVVDYSRPELAASAPRISIVIPSFNQGKFLETTLRSVLEQNYPNLELIVMDGGSTDASAEIIKRYQDRISYWQSQPDEGQYWAINAGFGRSTGEIMAWINSDDKLHRNSLHVMASAFQQLPDVEWITGIPNTMNEEGAIQWASHPIPVFARANYLRKKYDFPSFIQQEGTFWRRTLWEKSGACLRTEFRMAGDLELWTRFFRHAPLHTIDTFTGCFRLQKDQKTAKAMALYRAEADEILSREIARVKKSRERIIAPAPPIAVRYPQDNALAADAADAPAGACAAEGAYTVSAIVSTYNSERFLRGCLDDLEAQTIADRIEIIVIDSGSAQNERAIVAEYQARYANIRYIRTEQRETVYAAWNRGAQAATGRYLTNANTDDRHRHDALERLAAELDARPDVALVYADCAVTRQENARYESAHVVGHFRWPDYDRTSLFQTCYIGPQPMWRRDLHARHGYFDAGYRSAGDYEFWLRMAAHEHYHHVGEVLGLYLTSPGSVESSNAELSVRESERARVSHWKAAWGRRPQTPTSYFVPVTPAPVSRGKRAKNGPRPLVSVILPTCDRPALLKDALASLVAQDYPDWEAVVINDGGADIEALVLAADPAGRIRYFAHDACRGPGAARNTGLRHAQGEIIAYLDDDDLFMPNHLSTVVTALGDNVPGFVYTDARHVTERLVDGVRTVIKKDSGRHAHQDYSRQRLLVANYIPINTWAHHRACVEKSGLFDENLPSLEDWDFLLKLARHFEFRHIAEVTVEVRERPHVVDSVSTRGRKDFQHVYREIYTRTDELADGRIRVEREKILENLQAAEESNVSADDLYRIWMDRHAFDESAILRCNQRMEHWQDSPVVHVVVDLQPGQQQRLADTLDSLGAQALNNWRLSVVADQPAPDGLCDELDILHWETVSRPDDRGAILNNVVAGIAADWVVLATAGDRFAPQFSFMIADYANRHPQWRLIYSDEDRIDSEGRRHAACFKPDFNPDLLRSMPYMGECCAVSRELLLRIGGYAPLAAARNYDVALRVLDACGADGIGHIADVLCHRPEETVTAQTDAVAAECARQALLAHLQRNGIDADVQAGVLPGSCFVDYRHHAQPLVSIIIVASGRADALRMCVKSLLEKTDYPHYEVLVADTGSLQEDASGCIGEIAPDPRVRLLRLPGESGIAALNNRAARAAGGEYLLLLADDTIVIQPNWLSRLMAHGQRPEVGIVGARLVGPDQRVQHAGIILGMGEGVADLAFGGLPMTAPGYMGRAQVVQNFSAVSAACMLIRKSLYADVGGMDERRFKVMYHDVDLCLKAGQRGHRIVWTPYATLMHHGSLSLSVAQDPERSEHARRDAGTMSGTWLPQLAHDAAFSRHLSLQSSGIWCAETDLDAPEQNIDSPRPRILGTGLGSDGSWLYRGIAPLRALHRHGMADCVLIRKYLERIRMPTLAELERTQPQAMLLYNTIHDGHLAALERYRGYGKTLRIFGLDDLATELPQKNPFRTTLYKDIKKRIRTALSLSDRLIVTTEPLADACRGMIDDIRVVPNYLERSRWETVQPQRRNGAKPRVGWAGALQHQGDLELLVEVVKATASELDWVFLGMCPDAIRPFVAEYHPPVLFEKYPAKLASLDLDLAVAPLEYNRFNEAKSNLRLLEYGIMGWPVVCSNIFPYQNAPVERVANNSRAWLNAIRARAFDREAAAVEGARLRQWVLDHWILEDHLDEWLAALAPGLESVRRQPVESAARGRIVGA